MLSLPAPPLMVSAGASAMMSARVNTWLLLKFRLDMAALIGHFDIDLILARPYKVSAVT